MQSPKDLYYNGLGILQSLRDQPWDSYYYEGYTAFKTGEL